MSDTTDNMCVCGHARSEHREGDGVETPMSDTFCSVCYGFDPADRTKVCFVFRPSSPVPVGTTARTPDAVSLVGTVSPLMVQPPAAPASETADTPDLTTLADSAFLHHLAALVDTNKPWPHWKAIRQRLYALAATAFAAASPAPADTTRDKAIQELREHGYSEQSVESVRRGLEDITAGRVHDLGSFAPADTPPTVTCNHWGGPHLQTCGCIDPKPVAAPSQPSANSYDMRRLSLDALHSVASQPSEPTVVEAPSYHDLAQQCIGLSDRLAAVTAERDALRAVITEFVRACEALGAERGPAPSPDAFARRATAFDNLMASRPSTTTEPTNG